MRNTIDTTSRGRVLKVAWIGLCMACMPSAWAQEPLVETFLTKDNLLIGEPSLLKIRATYPVGGYTVNWFTLPDSLPHFAVVERGAVDSTVVDGQVRLEQPIKFTSFDSGQWATPRLSVNFIPKAGGQAVSLQTNALPFTVNYVLDTTLVLNDIKPIMQGETEGWPWWWFAVGAAALGLLVLLGWLLYRYLNKKMPAAAPLKTSRYEEIIQQLAALRQLDIAQTEPCRQFHTRLASLFKAYMEQPTGVSLNHQTTGDTLLYLKRTLSSEQLAKVADTLRGCDAVKFAKFMPPVAQSHQWLNDIRACIEQMEKREVAG